MTNSFEKSSRAGFALRRVAQVVVVVVANLIFGIVAIFPILLFQLSIEKVRPGESEDLVVPGLFLVFLLWVLIMAGIANYLLRRSLRMTPILVVGLAVVSLVAPMALLQLAS